MGSSIFRNRYWYYKSLYDDYIGREFRMAFGLSMLIWMPHYWYAFTHAGMVFISTEPLKRTPPIKTISYNGTPAGIDSLTISFSKSLKW
jgi:hypothetical protein